jgi:tripartite-type tricarboxylate transporter receptor subunit TctC
MVHVPYKGTAPALVDVLAGNPSVMLANPLSAGPHIKAGKLRALAVTSTKRLSSLPDVPTLAEAGLPAFSFHGLWFGVIAPAGTPQAVVQRLNQEFRKVLEAPEVRQKLEEGGMEPAGDTPEAFRTFLQQEVQVWSRVIKTSGIKAQ